MSPLPQREGYIAWVRARLDRDLTLAERELVTILCTGLGVGPWNVHRDWSVMRQEGHGASMHTTRDLSTYDSDTLTRLVFAAHDRCCRLTVVPSGPRGLRITVWLRKREGQLHERHPSLEEAVGAWHKEWPTEEA